MDFNIEETVAYGYIAKWFEIINKTKDKATQLEELTKWLGEKYECERSYIFELGENNTFSNTYEWCSSESAKQKDNLQNENLEDWFEIFSNDKNIVIRDIEEIKNESTSIYAILKPHNVKNLIAVPMKNNNKLIGFVGVDNPKIEINNESIDLMELVSKMFSYIICSKKMANHLEYLIMHDELTSTENRNALDKKIKEIVNAKKLGVIYIDILDLVETGDEDDNIESDKIVVKCSNIFSEIFYEYNIYRVAGEKFLILMENIDSKKMNDLVYKLDNVTKKSNINLCIGLSFDDSENFQVEKVIKNAKTELEKNKSNYFLKSENLANDENKKNNFLTNISVEKEKRNVLLAFAESNSINLDTFFSAIDTNDDFFPYVGNLKTNMWYISDSMKELWGFESNIVVDLLPKWEKFIVSKEDVNLFRDKIQRNLIPGNSIHDLVYKIKDKNNEEFWIRCFGMIEWNEDNTEAISFCGNVTKLNYAFVVDPVTNFMREQAAIKKIVSMIQNNYEISYVCFKLNNFLDINQLVGKEKADELLRKISEDLATSFSKTNIYRLDGLRFIIILQSRDNVHLKKIAEKVQKIVENVYERKKIFIKVPCSVGIINFGKKDIVKDIMDDISSIFDLMKNKITDEIYSLSDTFNYSVENKKMLMTLNHEASNNLENFRIVVQPIVSASTGKIVSGEALLRWKYKGKDISPLTFIPELENTGLIIPVGRWVFEQSAKVSKRARTYNKKFFLDFNVSYHQINDDGFSEFIKDILEKLKLSGDELVLELTENHYDDDPEKLDVLMGDVKELNMKIALDDFGVGYSSLEMLFKYPADIVKLDKTIMKKMSDEKKNSKFISTIIYACHKIGKLVCVEGVETKKEYEIVKEAGVDLIQGYYFYKPMSLEDFYKKLSENS